MIGRKIDKMKKITLTQNQVAFVDDEDFERLNQFKWHTYKSQNTFYARRNLPRVKGKQTGIYMHHEVIGKPPEGFETDHHDGNGRNNRQNNLRHVTARQNGQNLHCKKSSQYSGVCWHKGAKKWMARIGINGIDKYLGLFANELEAFTAYKQAVENIGEKVIGDKL